MSELKDGSDLKSFLTVISEYKPSQRQTRQLQHILELQKACEKTRIPFCIAGGYSVDALYGALTRDHYDLEVFIREEFRDQFLTVLRDFGYRNDPNKIFEDKIIMKTEILGDIFFQIDFRTLEQLDPARHWDYTQFFPDVPTGKLEGNPIRTMTIKGYNIAQEAFQKRALQKGWPVYDKSKYNDRVFELVTQRMNINQ